MYRATLGRYEIRQVPGPQAPTAATFRRHYARAFAPPPLAHEATAGVFTGLYVEALRRPDAVVLLAGDRDGEIAGLCRAPSRAAWHAPRRTRGCKR